MTLVNLTLEQCKWILECYWKTENVSEAQSHWRNKFGPPPQTRATVTKMRDKYEVFGTVKNVKGRSGRPEVQRMMKVLRQC
jgi:hypothetical protein